MYCLMYLILNFASVTLCAPNAKIIEGHNALILANPYMVSIEFLGTHNCGGSLIKRNLVLTAAHCFYMSEPSFEIPLKSLSVRVGTAIIQKDGVTAKLKAKCVHPKYTYIAHSNFVDYDEAVAVLDRYLLLNSRTQVIQLQPKNIIVPDGSIGKVSGWGILKNTLGPPEVSLILQEVRMAKINQEICKSTSLLTVTDRFTCFGSGTGTAGFCSGDSGGPIVVDAKQVGIVSYALGCGLPLFFHNFYTRVENEEIRNHIDECVSKYFK